MALITRFEQGSIDNCEDLALAIELALRDSFRHVGQVTRERYGRAIQFETENEGYLITVSIDPEGYFDPDGSAIQPDIDGAPPDDNDDDEDPPGPCTA